MSSSGDAGVGLLRSESERARTIQGLVRAWQAGPAAIVVRVGVGGSGLARVRAQPSGTQPEGRRRIGRGLRDQAAVCDASRFRVDGRGFGDTAGVSDARLPATGELAELERDECVELLSVTRFGRLAVSLPDPRLPPVIRPITYVFDRGSQSIVFRSARGSKFSALLLSGEATFEIDGIEPAAETGWSVIVQGPIEEITNTTEINHLEQLGLHPWAPGEKPHWIRIRAYLVSGRRITP